MYLHILISDPVLQEAGYHGQHGLCTVKLVPVGIKLELVCALRHQSQVHCLVKDQIQIQ